MGLVFQKAPKSINLRMKALHIILPNGVVFIVPPLFHICVTQFRKVFGHSNSETEQLMLAF
jgi:hypothetical protein